MKIPESLESQLRCGMHPVRPGRQRRAVALGLATAGLLAAGSAQAVSFYAYAATSGNPGPSGTHTDVNSGAVPVQAASNHAGQSYTPHANDPGATVENVTAQASARADMNGVHLLTAATGAITTAEPYYSSAFAADADARAALGDSFVLQPGVAGPSFASTLMSLHFSIRGPLTAYGTTDPLDPLNPGGGLGRARWHADLSAYDDTAGVELGRLILDQTCSMSSGDALFQCVGDAAGSYSMAISAPVGHTLSISINGETWASASGAQSRGGSVWAAGQADFSHTIAWGGITDLRDENGNALSGYTAISASSGYDYVVPFPSAVPEPQRWALIASGLAVLGWRRRRFRL